VRPGRWRRNDGELETRTLTSLPRAFLIDLDDTLISAYGNPGAAWVRVADMYRARLGTDTASLAVEITDTAQAFWSDEARHKEWRHKLQEARRRIVGQVLQRRGLADTDLADKIADRYSRLREEEMHLFPHALDVLKHFRQRGVRLCLITNGAAATQRAKIERFGLAGHFDHIQIEGEHGFGKPELRAYEHALRTLDAPAEESWILGDNLVWEVQAPQRLGLHAIWCDRDGKGVPAGSNVTPDRIISCLSELMA
jgi:putative hydrolase of the HAD superfamily